MDFTLLRQFSYIQQGKKILMRRPGIEPGSTAWKAAMLTTIPPTLVSARCRFESTSGDVSGYNGLALEVVGNDFAIDNDSVAQW